MKKIIQILLLQITIVNSLFAQEIFVEIKNEFTASEVKFKWEENLSNQSGIDEIIYNFSIGLSGKVYKKVFLKTTIGSNDFKNSINVDWDSEKASHLILGWVHTSQNYFEILPEVRFLKNNLLFVNMGMGFNQIKTSELINGFYYRRTFSNPLVNYEREFPNFSGKYEYFVLNFGTNLQYKNVGIILEYGIKRSGYTDVRIEIPGIGVNQKSFKLGISYKLN